MRSGFASLSAGRDWAGRDAGARSGRVRWPQAGLRDHVRAGGAGDDPGDIGQCADGRAFAGLGGEPDRGLDFGTDGSAGEVITGEFTGCDAVEPPLLRRAPVEVDAVDVGGHEEQVRAYVLGEHLAGQVLVDDGFGVGQDARCRGGADRGNASAACADDHGPVVKQPGDGLDLQDLLGFG